MHKIWKGLAIIGIVAIAGVIVAQFVSPQKGNPRVDPTQTIEARTHMPQQVADILNRTCRDCHTNQTSWQWYGNIAPGSWLMIADVYVARSRMNLSNWGTYTPAQQADRLRGMCRRARNGSMPLWYYRALHYPSAWLSSQDVNTLCEWTQSEGKLLGVPPAP
ncbi:MAG: heme-binding domain-containing protein [Acidobacteria bacterium]|nr:heme-binding domain-containing protein [Acidobacteriota bacterium]